MATTVPPSPLEEYYGLRTHYIEAGKYFDQNVIIKDINDRWVEAHGGNPPLAEVAHPEIIPESPQRARLVKMEDARAIAEVEQAKALARADLAQKSSVERELELERSRREQLEAQLAELRDQQGSEAFTTGTPPLPPLPSAEQPKTTMSGVPDASWSRTSIVEFLKGGGYELPPKNAQFMSTIETLEFALDQIRKREEDGDGGEPKP